MNCRSLITQAKRLWTGRRPGNGGRRAGSAWTTTRSVPCIPRSARYVCKATLALLIGALLRPPATAQQPSVLHAGLIKTQGYVVGAPLVASGLQRFDGGETWTHLGWNIPRVSGLAYDPTNPDILFLACGNGGLRSLDGGRSWRITTDWRVTEVQDVAVDPNEPTLAYLATAYGVWATTDRGETWREANDGLSKKYTQAVAADRTHARRVFAGTEGGLFVSEDGALSWTQVAAFEDVLDIQQSPTAPQTWLAGTQNDGVLTSSDGGRTWQPARQRTLRQATIYAVAIDPNDASRMAAAGWDTNVLISTNGGRSWKQRGKRLPTPHFYEIIFDPNVPGRLWAATVEKGIFYSDDLGQHWTPAGMDGTLVFDMIFIPGKRD